VLYAVVLNRRCDRPVARGQCLSSRCHVRHQDRPDQMYAATAESRKGADHNEWLVSCTMSCSCTLLMQCMFKFENRAHRMSSNDQGCTTCSAKRFSWLDHTCTFVQDDSHVEAALQRLHLTQVDGPFHLCDCVAGIARSQHASPVVVVIDGYGNILQEAETSSSRHHQGVKPGKLLCHAVIAFSTCR
jgi:hypothetical protein